MKKLLLYTALVLIATLAAYYFYPMETLPPGKTIDRIVVLKSERIMEVYHGDVLLKRYTVSLGKNDGDKQLEGDKRTPEGSYTINGKNPNSAYHKNLGISYPDADDRRKAKARNVSPGGDVKIHGLRNGIGFIGKFHRMLNWTAGCVAVTNEEMDELYARVRVGTPIEIKP